MIGEGYMLMWFVFLVVFKTSSLTFILFSLAIVHQSVLVFTILQS